jgi:hypothetical protein
VVVPLGAPGGPATTSGQFRFTCQTRAPTGCDLSIGAAVISPTRGGGGGTMGFYPRVTIQKQATGGDPMTFCEYADGAFARVPLVPDLASAQAAMQDSLRVDVGGTLDCGAGQTLPPNGVRTITVPGGSAGGTGAAFYDVWVTVGFGEPPAVGRRPRLTRSR